MARYQVRADARELALCVLEGGSPYVEATRWFQNGNHPEDRSKTFIDPKSGLRWQGEGHVVRYFRRPNMSGATLCEKCASPMHVHGWLDVGPPRASFENEVVCPGDYVITNQHGERGALSATEFFARFEEAPE